MAVLGKRKARPAPSDEPSAAAKQEMQDVFRRHFEARFEPLPVMETPPRMPDAAADVSESEWGGLSDVDDEADGRGSGRPGRVGALLTEGVQDPPAVEVVDYSASQTPSTSAMSKREFKAFMSSRPPDQASKAPTATTTPTPSSSSSHPLPEDAPSLLAQDLELRRLLAESHLLSPQPSASLSVSSSSSAAPGTTMPKSFPAGRTRLKATDLRIQALGSKLSILKQDKMPMNMRKGIVAAATSRKDKRRREARESGVILERELGNKRRRDRARDGDVHRPGVGRLKGAELRLSERDVKGIEGRRDTFGRRGARAR
ncbi:hypothetical protein OCS_04524 [Ophiocordyceps sinensis CO18]|uniref:Uncharacterized protein n=1 Tax=Ophiocordyceps sinensis (strain Co18 / CGMCC 3.14243) TaxID=911162 RepID=T5A2U6_OPHSC|nr:hypothetical protein OCS_04524 [Ophiocordyceps sinensis CO18]